MAVKVYRYPENPKEMSEDFEFIGDYTNYNEDEFEQLPYIGNEFPEIVKKFDKTFDNSVTVVYKCDTLEDVKKAYPNYDKGGEFYGGEFSFSTPSYYVINPEWGNTVIVVPKNLKKDVVKYIKNLEREEELKSEKEYKEKENQALFVKETNEDKIATLEKNFKEILKDSKYEENTSMNVSLSAYEDIWFSNFYETPRIHFSSFILLRINFMPELKYEIHISFEADKANFREDFGGYSHSYEGTTENTYLLEESTITKDFLKEQLNTLRKQVLEDFKSQYAEKEHHTPQFLEAVQDAEPEKYFINLINSSKETRLSKALAKINSSQAFLQ